MSCRSAGVGRAGCAASGTARSAGNQADNHSIRESMALIYLLLFASPQLLLYLYLRERLPASARRWLTLVFVLFNIPWGIVAVRMFSGSLWGMSRVPYIAPFIAWQSPGSIFTVLVAVYILAKTTGRFGWWALRKPRNPPPAEPPKLRTATPRPRSLRPASLS